MLSIKRMFLGMSMLLIALIVVACGSSGSGSGSGLGSNSRSGSNAANKFIASGSRGAFGAGLGRVLAAIGVTICGGGGAAAKAAFWA